MTTFTMQDLNNSNNINDIPTAEEEEAMKTLFEQMGKDLTQPAPTLQQVVENMAIPQAPEPQHTAGTNVPTIESVIDAISSHYPTFLFVLNNSYNFTSTGTFVPNLIFSNNSSRTRFASW